MLHPPFPCAEFSQKLLEYIQTVVIPSRPLEVRFKQNCLDELANKEGWKDERGALKKEVDELERGYDEYKPYVDVLNNIDTPLEKEINLRLHYEKNMELLRKRIGLLRVKDETDPAGEKFKNISGTVGIVETLSDGREGYVAIDHKECPAPTYLMLRQKFRERCEADPVFLRKFSQGFYHMLLVPKGAKLVQFVEQYESTLLERTQKGGKGLFFTRNGLEKRRTRINECPYYGAARGVYMAEQYCKGGKITNEEGGIIDDSLLLYGPRYEDGKIVGGKRKEEYVKEGTFPGWNVLFLEKDVNIPAYIKPEDKDYTKQVEKITHGGRRRLEAGETPLTYMKKLQEDPQYAGERGMTPEEWLLFADMIASTTGQVIDDVSGKGRINYLIGSVFDSGRVSHSYWNRDYARAVLDWYDPINRPHARGVRPVVTL